MNPSSDHCLALGHHKAKAVWAAVSEDIVRYLKKSPENRAAGDNLKTRLGAFLTAQILCLVLYRVAHCLLVRGWPRSAAMMHRLNLLIHKVNISPQSCIGPGCLLSHPVGVTFHGTAGRGLTLYALSVCCPRAASMGGPTESGPRLGDRVTVGGQAGVVGPVTVGDDVKVAPKTCVDRDVPPAVLVVSRAMRVTTRAAGAGPGTASLNPEAAAALRPGSAMPRAAWASAAQGLGDDSKRASPVLSVIIPTFNRAATLGECLRALCSQSCSSNLYELIVADDGSSDETGAVVKRFAERDAPRIRYLRQRNAGANSARNRAIRVARGRILLFINDDIMATPTMLAEHLVAHQRFPDDRVAVLGRATVSPALSHSRLAPLHLDHAYAHLDSRTVLDWRAFYTCNVSVKKSLLERGGLFEERIRYHEDLELAERLSHHGLRVVYRPQALGYHDHGLTEEEYLAVAAREAQALVVWARIAPDRRQVLGSLGFLPAMSLGQRIRHQGIRLLVNRLTIGLWRWIARRCPSRHQALSLAIYRQTYQCRKRGEIRRLLRSS